MHDVRRKLILILLVNLFIIMGCSEKSTLGRYVVRKDQQGTEMIVGQFPLSALKTPAFPWFEKNFQAYIPDSQIIQNIKGKWDGVRILIVLGTWCPDSRREVPRFYRIAEETELSFSMIGLYGVDRKKMGTDATPEVYGIERVPTFIFLKDGKEIGRIVESPSARPGGLENDILEILSRAN